MFVHEPLPGPLDGVGYHVPGLALTGRGRGVGAPDEVVFALDGSQMSGYRLPEESRETWSSEETLWGSLSTSSSFLPSLET